MRIHQILCETLQDWDTGRWVHFSDHDMMTINAKPFHQDPLGIYFFPASFKPETSMWANKRHKFTVAFAHDARILDYSATTDEQLAAMLDATKATAEFADYITQYPPKDRRKKLDMAWEQMRRSMMWGAGAGDGNNKALWNRLLRQLGWDAIFDDTGSIHSSEVQMLVLNPRIIRPVEMQASKVSAFAGMQKVVADLKAACAPFGEVTVEEPRKKRESRYDTEAKLVAVVRVERGERNYAYFTLRNDPKDRNHKHKIDANLTYSMPRLNYGFGVTFDMMTGEYDSYLNITKVPEVLKKIFGGEP